MNFIDESVVARASALVQHGRVVPCALPFDDRGPRTGAFNRTGPMPVMLQSGGDIAIGAQDHPAELRYTDDAVFMPLQCGTQRDALAHIFQEGRMYNRWDLSHVPSTGATQRHPGRCVHGRGPR